MKCLSTEIELARLQGAPNILKEGLVIAMTKNGKVVRRGIGIPPWKPLLDKLKV